MHDRKAWEIEQAWTEHVTSTGALRPNLPVHRRHPALFRARLAEAQNWRCCYCGCRMDEAGPKACRPTLEHVVPRSLGGTHEPSNVVVACLLCNQARGAAWRPEHAEFQSGAS